MTNGIPAAPSTATAASSGQVSVVIPSYRSWPVISQTLSSLEGQGALEVIVVDSSNDETAERIRAAFPKVKVLESATRCLPGKARNLGARAALGKYVAFVDADVIVSEDWLRKLLDHLAEHPSAGAAGGAITNDNPETLASRVLYWIEFSEFVPGSPAGFRQHLSSSNLLLPRESFLSSSRFSEDLAMAEDLRFCLEWREGRLSFEPEAKVRHRHRDQWRPVRGHLRRLGYWSGVYRRSRPEATGAWLQRVPFLSFGLPLLRLPRILARMHKSGGVGLFQCALHGLPLGFGLLFWTSGFYRGISGKPDESRDRSY